MRLRKVHFKILCYCKDYMMAIIKLVLGIILHSSFMWIYAIFNICMGTARRFCVKNNHHEYRKQCQVYKHIAFLLILAGTVYSIYNMRLFFLDTFIPYHKILGISIAAFTFIECGFNIKEIIRVRKKHKPLEEAQAFLSLASICTCFPLTQMALTSLHRSNGVSVGNGITALIFGTMILFVGVYMCVRMHKLEKAEF